MDINLRLNPVRRRVWPARVVQFAKLLSQSQSRVAISGIVGEQPVDCLLHILLACAHRGEEEAGLSDEEDSVPQLEVR